MSDHEHDWEKIGKGIYRCRICKEPGYGIPPDKDDDSERSNMA